MSTPAVAPSEPTSRLSGHKAPALLWRRRPAAAGACLVDAIDAPAEQIHQAPGPSDKTGRLVEWMIFSLSKWLARGSKDRLRSGLVQFSDSGP
ncbi:Large ribosomal subunit protein [Trichinella spiralis]|uniref:Large ribosomal subunit protein n=1 Tax=Trichinella spiralis TaxID=6334 RepID=A0ABR3KVX9_TRISP